MTKTQIIQKVAPFITILVLFILLMYVVYNAQALVNSRDQEWVDYIKGCKCACTGLQPTDGFGNITLSEYGNVVVNLSLPT